jgi:acetyl esterase/lipase
MTSVAPGRAQLVVGLALLMAVVAGCAASSSAAGRGTGAVVGPSPSAPFALVAGVFLPPGATESGEPVPLVVLVPGGGWLSADPSGMTQLGARLAADGAAVVTTTYRTQAEGASFPVPIEDVVCAIDEAAARVADSGVSVGPVVVAGHSAGAELAALAALVGDRYQAGCPSPAVRIDGLVGMAGPYDLVALAALAAPLFTSTPTEDPDTWRAASPIDQVAARPDLPVLLLHGEADEAVPPSGSEDFAAALESAGHPVTLDLLPGVDHHGIYSAERAAPRIEDFVQSLGTSG